jgi:hypothetical protein
MANKAGQTDMQTCAITRPLRRTAQARKVQVVSPVFHWLFATTQRHTRTRLPRTYEYPVPGDHFTRSRNRTSTPNA